MLSTILFCRRALALLPDFVDGELAESARGDVRKHLRICHACRDKFEFEARVLAETRERLQLQAALEIDGNAADKTEIFAEIDAEILIPEPKPRELGLEVEREAL